MDKEGRRISWKKAKAAVTILQRDIKQGVQATNVEQQRKQTHKQGQFSKAFLLG